ncbi:ABC transporter substrate-binding protein [Spirochaeta lutea]|uniref:ABC transporter substrate-binding protein n=1 Tax=Spirochaeta lutea TaxID=1480694 RepID=A0A098R137_9SPIO|nr:extracellular solute-binding protein [Spirochaeta lutea]KGE73491.1 hypothetical protein DC28_03335 [Spirochaeta lutea]
MKPSLYSPLAALLLVSILSCGQPDQPRNGQAGTADPPGTASQLIGHALKYDPNKSVNGGKPIQIEFWTQVDYEDIYQQLVQDYMALHPNVEITLSSLSWSDHRSRLAAALETGIGPDLFHMHNSMSSQLIAHLEPYPRTVFPLEILEQDFRQVRSHLLDGHLYFIDTGLMTGAMLYNIQHWKEAGLTDADIPKNWDQLYALAQKLTIQDDDGTVIRAGFNPNGMGYPLFAALNLQQGLPLFSYSNPRRPLIAFQESLRSLEYIRRFYTEPRVTDPYLPEAHESFGFGSSSIIYAWGWVLNWLNRNAPQIDFATFPLPSWTGEIPPAYDRNNGEVSMGVNRHAPLENQAVAFDLIAYYLASDAYLLTLSQQFGTYPSKISLDANDGIVDGQNLSAFQTILERTVWPGALPQTYEEHLVRYVLDPVLIDGADPVMALVTADRVITPIMRFESFLSREQRYVHAGEFKREYYAIPSGSE